MRLELTGRHVAITSAVRKLVEQRLVPLRRMLNDSAVSAQIVLTREKSRHHADITLHVRGEHFFHGEATGRDVGSALAAAVDRIDRQAQRLKSKWTEGRRRGAAAARSAAAATERAAAGPAPQDGATPPRIIRARRYAVKPMSIEDAAAVIGDRAGAVLVFRNSATDAVTVLFRRPDGNLGLIEPEA